MVILSELPADPATILSWSWDHYVPYVDDLLGRRLADRNVESFLADWSALGDRIDETYRRLYVATSRNTTNRAAEEAFHRFLDETWPFAEEANQRLKEKLLASGLEPDGFEVPLRKMRTEAAIFRHENLPLLADERKFEEEYNQILGAQMVQWEGEQRTIPQMQPLLQENDRALRERAWRMSIGRQMEDREALSDLWVRALSLRRGIAANAGMDSYLDYRWRQMLRFDYTPDDCRRFHQAIAEVAVPAASRILDRRRQRLGVDSIRTWDRAVDPLGRPPLRPFAEVGQLIEGTATIFRRVDPHLGGCFQRMIDEDLLDLDSRKDKGPGGFCDEFPASKQPFIFMNAVGVQDDVQTLLHEGGHAFHAYECQRLPWHQQRDVGLEFAEVASMSMELLASPYLPDPGAGLFDDAEAARARIEHSKTLSSSGPTWRLSMPSSIGPTPIPTMQPTRHAATSTGPSYCAAIGRTTTGRASKTN